MTLPLRPASRDAAMPADVRVLRALLLVGTAALATIWWLEARAGVISVSDGFMYPLLIVVFSGCSVWLFWYPAKARWAKAIANAMVIVHLVSTVHMVLFFRDGTIDLFQLSTAMFWMPLCYSSVFVFFSLRIALTASALTFTVLIGPIIAAYALGSVPAWGPNFPVMVVNLALAQLTYVAMLFAIALMRTDFARTTERAKAMQALAVTDALTGLPNRRALTELLTAQMALSYRGEQTLSVVLIDVDHFKQVNDRHGHAVGDAVLVQLGEVLQSQVRVSDRVGRWGGEEFLVVAPATTLWAAADVAERIRQSVAEWPFAHQQEVTISLGVTQVLPGDGLDTLLQRADRALYRAKQRGRNCVEHQSVAIAS